MVRLFARAWASKKSMAEVEEPRGRAISESEKYRVRRKNQVGGSKVLPSRLLAPRISDYSSEIYLRRTPLGGIVDLEKLGGLETKHAGENHVGEDFA